MINFFTPAPIFPRIATLNWLLVSLIMVILPHVSRLPLWTSLFFILFLLWRFLGTAKQYGLPSQLLKTLFACLVVVGILYTYRTLFGRDPGVALLVALCSLKMIEMHNQRDALLICFLGYFLIITNFLYSQTILTALYMFIVMLVMTATLIGLSDYNERLTLWKRLRLGGLLLFQAIPLMLVLFIFFPRVAGPLWGIPKDAFSGVTGLTNNMLLGNISELTVSDEIAFRAKFENDKIPSHQERYWRGPVFSYTDGKEWKSDVEKNMIVQNRQLTFLDTPYTYTVTLEPHNQRWVFALDMPTKTPDSTFSNQKYEITTFYPVRQRMRYQVTSYTHYRAELADEQLLKLNLTLPANMHPRAKALAKQWQQENPDPLAIAQRALQYFNQEPFHYTLTPLTINKDPVDEFLFETREGFCEHYAAAFTVLMRAAGIPARIVTGYQGGEFNSVGNYLVVRQRDAHAWSEIWIAGTGWVRIEPTGAVAPERIERGATATFASNFDTFAGFEMDNNSQLGTFWRQLQENWDALNNDWNQWVLGYDNSRQKEFFSNVGIKDATWQNMTIALVVLVATLLLGISLWLLKRAQRYRDPVQQLYYRFCQQLARAGITHHASEPPLKLSQRATTLRPDLAQPIQKIITLYIAVRYRSQIDLLPALQKAIRQFHS
ncbi:transglutaminase TgpA family protein [Beggiatoa leptomitoformis]|uniref:DUF3488 domain-containing protein n=1 Tax=Beggiatoa leptomitoformis TaxID=288004 RepID=A0A2N9YA75_9GAMM|nr:DUF3488 and transglutaminase-like domain-containing protein [Beggiatoa leptomitoformis]ALG67226.1 DUF3488 domain-containing protein [Beggiatoa leptomitoformis]AUI67360.1 DUF3488 domain-containing protein [Beggiatoa leptomitoformis]